MTEKEVGIIKIKVTEIKQFLSENQTWAKKSFGQHFLVDENVLSKIVATAELSKSDRVLEIGPGLGVLTDQLIERAGEVVAIEADRFLASCLAKKYQTLQHVIPVKAGIQGLEKTGSQIKSGMTEKDDFGLSTFNFQLIEGDALKVIDSLEFKRGFRSKPYKVIANIPYSITSKLLRLLLEEYQPTSITFLVQKEVAERVCAKPGRMSLLSLSVQYFGTPKIIATVPAGAFWPQPKVESAILHIKLTTIHTPACRQAGKSIHREDTENLTLPTSEESEPTSEVFTGKNNETMKQSSNELFKLARIGLGSKRKMLAHNLSTGLSLPREEIVDIIKSVGLKETVRAQELSVKEWEELSRSLANLQIWQKYK